MSTKMETLTNSFHGTTIRVRASSAALLDGRDPYLMSKAQKTTLRRIRRTLCPSCAHGCMCGVVRP